MKNIERFPEVYRIASKYALAVLGYEGENMRATEAYNLRREIGKRTGWSFSKTEEIWDTELKFALRFWDVPIEVLMANNA